MVDGAPPPQPPLLDSRDASSEGDVAGWGRSEGVPEPEPGGDRSMNALGNDSGVRRSGKPAAGRERTAAGIGRWSEAAAPPACPPRLGPTAGDAAATPTLVDPPASRAGSGDVDEEAPPPVPPPPVPPPARPPARRPAAAAERAARRSPPGRGVRRGRRGRAEERARRGPLVWGGGSRAATGDRGGAGRESARRASARTGRSLPAAEAAPPRAPPHAPRQAGLPRPAPTAARSAASRGT
mmetsp:Transcript_8905/g.28270  ORF Transcript_8905/g.28270 Transcript_8905/m.28270 type:complete len:239 (+) Transcript_8905:841-1557(+)